jgi:hypothetical protein
LRIGSLAQPTSGEDDRRAVHLHYLVPPAMDDRRRRWGAALAWWSDRAGLTDDLVSVQRAAAGLRRLFPSLRDVGSRMPGRLIDITSDHLPPSPAFAVG